MSKKRRLNVEEKAVKCRRKGGEMRQYCYMIGGIKFKIIIQRNILCPIDPEMYSIKLKSSKLLLNNKENATKQLLERNCWSADVFLDSIELEIIY